MEIICTIIMLTITSRALGQCIILNTKPVRNTINPAKNNNHGYQDLKNLVISHPMAFTCTIMPAHDTSTPPGQYIVFNNIEIRNNIKLAKNKMIGYLKL